MPQRIIPFLGPPKHQADAVLSQADPTSGEKYPILDTTSNVRIIGASARVTWTVQPTPLEVHITVDGQLITHVVANPVSLTSYQLQLAINGGANGQVLSGGNWAIPFFYEGRSVKVEAEITGGTVQLMEARVKYAKW